ncbi:MAG: hypothetical protein ABJV04_02915 [Aliiglaciecola sp.]|uniref:hypothetical protein n=1 Tax=Alteromonadaceae TaxID=72275 RepID=UPI003264CBF2
MKEINDIKAVLTEHRYCHSSELLAQALASACNRRYTVNLLTLSEVLDEYNQDLVKGLININYRFLPDLKAHEEALQWLKKEKFIK